MIVSTFYEVELAKDVFEEEYKKHGDNAYYNLVKPLLENVALENVVKIMAYTICMDKYVGGCIDYTIDTEDEDILRTYLFEQYEDENKQYTYLLDPSKPKDISKFEQILNFI